MLKLSLRTAAAAVAAGFMMTVGFGAASTPAQAEAVPFWERADLEAAKKAKAGRKSAYRSYAKKSHRHASKKSRKKLGGYAAASEPKRYKGKRVKVAALGNSYYPSEIAKPSISGGAVRWVASSGCLAAGLKSIMYTIAASYGPVTVNSTCRSKSRNRAVGGAHRSKHLSGDAVDFRVRGNVRAVYAFLKSSGSVGGLKHYGGGLFHIDNGDRRSW